MKQTILQCLLGLTLCLSINVSMANIGDSDSLFEAINQGDLQRITESELSKSLLESKGADGLTPLHMAITKQKPAIVLWLIEQGVSLSEDVALPNFKLPLIAAAAAFTPDKKILQALLNKGLELNVSINGLSILHLLSSAPLTPEHINIMQFILEQGLPVDGSIPGFTPLHMAIQQNNLTSARFLLSAGADKERLINLPGNMLDKLSPLAIAAFNNNEQLIRLILEHQVNINAQVAYGNNALYYLSFANQGAPDIHLVKLFIEAGASVSSATIKNLVPSSEAYAFLSKIHADENQRIETLFSAIENGEITKLEQENYQEQELNKKYPEHTWPLHYAIKNKQAEVVTWLINNGADINLNSGYDSVEQLASNSESPEVMLALVQAGVTFENYHKESWPLYGFTDALKVYLNNFPKWIFDNDSHYADDALLRLIKEQEVGLLERLVERGANFSKIPTYKYPLNIAIELGNAALVEIVARHIPLIAPSESSYKHPLLLAFNKGNAQVIEVLLAKGWQLPSFINSETLMAWLTKDATYYLGLICKLQSIDIDNTLNTEQILQYVDPLVQHCGYSLANSLKSYDLLSQALAAANYQKVEKLISLGADVNFAPQYNFTHLAMAIKNDNKQSIVFLLEHGAKLAALGATQLEVLVSQYFNEQEENKVFPLVKTQLSSQQENIDFTLKLSELIIQEGDEKLYQFITEHQLLTKDSLKPLCLEHMSAWSRRIFCYKTTILNESESKIYQLFATILNKVNSRPTEDHLNYFKAIANSGIDINRPLPTSFGEAQPAIFQAADRGELSVVEVLLAAGAKADIAVNDETVLTAAAEGGSLEVIKLIFSENTSIVDDDKLQKRLFDNLTLLYSRPENIAERYTAVTWLIEQGVNPVPSLIINAARQGQYAFIKWLYGYRPQLFDDRDLLQQAFVQAVTPNGSFLVRSKYDQDYIATLNLLKSYGADPKYRTESVGLNNDNYISQALLNGSAAIVNWLLSNETNVPFDFKGLAKSLLLLADNGQISIVDKLFTLGTNPDSRLENSQTLLIHALTHKDEALVDLLLAHKANVNLSSNEFPANFPLWQAVKNNQVEMVEVLIAAGANVNQKQKSELGESPLMLAVNLQLTDIAKLLLSKGANHLAKDKQGVDISERLAVSNDEMKALFAEIDQGTASTPMTLHVNHIQSEMKKWDVNSDGSLALYSGSDGGKSYLELWDEANQRAIRTLYINDDYKDLFIAKFIGKNRVIVSAYLESVEVIDITSGAIIYSTETAYQAALSPDNSQLVYASSDKTFLIDLKTLTVVSTWYEPIKEKLQFNSDGTSILGVDNYQRVVQFKAKEATPNYYDFYSQRQLTKPNQIEHIDGDNYLFASDSFNTIWQWNHKTNQVQGHYLQPEDKVNILAASADKKHFITVADENLYFWKYGQSEPVKSVALAHLFSGYTSPEQVTFVNDNDVLIIGDRQVVKLSVTNDEVAKHNLDAKDFIKKAFVLNEASLVLLTPDEVINLNINDFTERGRVSSNEMIISGATIDSNNFVVLTQNNAITYYDNKLNIKDKRAFELAESGVEVYSLDSQEALTEQGVLEKCMNRRLKLDVHVRQNNLLFACGSIYRFDLNTHSTQAFSVSSNYWDDFTVSDSAVIAVSSSSVFANSSISAFDVNNPLLKPQLLLGDINAGSVKYAPAIATVKDGLAFENSNFDIEIQRNTQQAPIILSSNVSSASDHLMLSQDENWLIRQRINYLEVWDVNTRTLKREIKHPVDITAIALSANNESLFIGDELGVISRVNFLTGELFYQTSYQQLAINSIRLSSDQQQLLVASKSVQIREAATGKLLNEIEHSGWDAELALYHDDEKKLLIEYSQRQEQNKWRSKVKNYVLAEKRFIENIQAKQVISVSPSGQYIVTKKAPNDYFRLNSVTGENQPFSYTVDDGYRTSQMQISDEGEIYVSHLTFIEKISLAAEPSVTLIAGSKQLTKPEIKFSDDLTWALYKPKPNELVWFDTFNSKQLGCAQAELPDDQSMMSVSLDTQTKGLVLTDGSGRKNYYAAQGVNCSQVNATFTKNSQELLTLTQQESLKNEYSETGISSMAVMDKSHSKVAMSQDNKLRILSLETSQVIGPIEADTLIWGMRFSDDGRLLALLTSQNKFIVLDSESGIEILNTDMTYNEVRSIEFSVDNQYVSVTSHMTTSMNRECEPLCEDIINNIDEGTQRWHIPSHKLVQSTRQVKSWNKEEQKLAKVDRNGKKVELLATSPYQVIGWQHSESSLSDNGHYFANLYLDELRIWSDKDKPIQTIKLDSIFNAYAAFVKEDEFVMVVESGGNINFYRTQTGEKVLTFTLNKNESWLVRDQQGHYDSQDPGDVKYAAWVSDNDPLEALPIEVFITDFFEPRLLAKVLSGETNFTSRQVTNLNRVRPSVKIQQVLTNESDDTLSVSVTVKEQAKMEVSQGEQKTIHSGVNGVALFRNGRQIAFQATKFSSQDNELSTKDIRFDNIQLPSRKSGEIIEFSAYAFNDDNVKSLTDVYSFKVPSNKQYQTTAYIVSVGINEFQNTAWNLDYAVEDADALNNGLFNALNGSDKFDRVINIKLTSNSNKAKPSKEALKAVFAGLTGQKIASQYLLAMPELKQIKRVRPNDTLIFTYAGHGYADPSGDFHLFPWDLAASEGKLLNSALLDSTINSSELENMLRDVDSNQFMMIIDACNSAASVEGRSFRPGPMGSSGLGQLAYNKKMMILTASQAEEFAIESDRLKHGLLTFSLVEEGLQGLKADHLPKDSNLFAKEWFQYALNRVPDLYQEILKDDIVSTDNRGIKIVPMETKPEQKTKAKDATQKPGLFDFWRQQDMVIKRQTAVAN